jgi:hypothetical protein
MSNPSEPDQGNEQVETESAEAEPTEAAGEPTEIIAERRVEAEQGAPTSDAATEVISPGEPVIPAERRYTAPSGFDGSTQKIDTPPEPATEVFSVPPTAPQTFVEPQEIPARGDIPPVPPARRRSWGWVVAVILVIAALVALAVLGTLLLTRNSKNAASQEDKVRTTIQNFDAAVQRGDLATLRSITCGTTRDSYVSYDERAWTETHARVAAAKQYPVVASIDQVVVNGDHAEANVTTFMAYAPQTRSTRSFDLQFRDEQWKICQAPSS